MNGILSDTLNQKALPTPVDNSALPPLPPPKIIQDDTLDNSSAGSLRIKPSPLPNSLNLSPSQAALQLPLTPMSPIDSTHSSGPSSSPTPPPDGKPKKSNPLMDLIDTERLYVDQLAGIIRKVASAWSRSNLPPPELDTMFRAVESIYKANRGLLAKLKEIGTTPSSPKALGDLLMRWIDDLEGPYTTFSTKFISGFDLWEPIANNPRLLTTLALFSSANPPPSTSVESHLSEPPLWTLDSLFLLPYGRLKYYKKLYGRLLKSTSPGRSDHKLLLGALDKLDKLLATLDARSDIKVASQAIPVLPSVETEDEVVVDMRMKRDSELPPPTLISDVKESSSESGSASRHASSTNSRASQDTAPTTDRGSTYTLSAPISDLERRLSTDRTLDLFTMTPRETKLQITTPGLTYTRELRISVDVTIEFTPKSTGEELVYQRGHIFLLTDLFIICERMLPSERAKYGPDGPEMMVIFPPLAGKHLRVSEVPDSDVALKVTVLRKETLTLKVPSAELRHKLLVELRDCIDMASSLHSRAKASQPPPVPPLNTIPRSTSSPFPSTPSSTADIKRSSESSTNLSPPTRAFSPGNNGLLDDRRFSPPQHTGSEASNRRWSPSVRPGDTTNKLVLSPDAHVQQVVQRVPSLQDPLPGPLFSPRTSSTAETILDPTIEHRGSGGPPPNAFMARQGGPFGPGQVGPSLQPGHTMPSSFTPGQIVTSQSYNSGQVVPPSRSTSISNQGAGGPQGPPPGPPGGQFGSPQAQYSGQNFSMPGPPGQYRGPPPGQHPGPPPHMHGYGPGIPRQNSPYMAPPRPPSEPSLQQNGHPSIRRSQSSFSMNSQYEHSGPSQLPPMPNLPGGYPARAGLARPNSFGSLHAPQPRPLLPSAQMSVNSIAMSNSMSFQEVSPPSSPVLEKAQGPVTSTISAQMKCKVFLKQQHAQWKSLGSARLKLYRELPTNVKQLVVEADNKDKSILISTIVLTDGVERIGKTGVAIELSDKGARTGVVYMIQLRNETSAGGLFDSLLAGSDRS